MDKGVRLQLQDTCTLTYRQEGRRNRRRSVVRAQRSVRRSPSSLGRGSSNRKSLDPPRAFLLQLKVDRYWSAPRLSSRGLRTVLRPPRRQKTEAVFQQPLGYGGVTKTVLVYLSFWRATIGLIDHRQLKLGLDGVVRDNRKEECSWGPYLEAPGCRDGKRNVRRGKRKWAQMQCAKIHTHTVGKN